MKRSQKLLFTTLVVALAGLFVSYFVTTRMWQRWDIDDDWAGQIDADSRELRQVLDDYRSATGEFPETLELISKSYQRPTDFGDPQSKGTWHYRKLSKTDYQLHATGASFVSSFDAMVFRYSRNYPEDWFRLLDSSHSKKFGDWHYITGFSSFEESP